MSASRVFLLVLAVYATVSLGRLADAAALKARHSARHTDSVLLRARSKQAPIAGPVKCQCDMAVTLDTSNGNAASSVVTASCTGPQGEACQCFGDPTNPALFAATAVCNGVGVITQKLTIGQDLSPRCSKTTSLLAGDCNGQPCPNQGVQTTVDSKAAVVTDNGAIRSTVCTITTNKTPCTTTTPCTAKCVATTGPWGDCVSAFPCGDGVQTRTVTITGPTTPDCPPTQQPCTTGSTCGSEFDCKYLPLDEAFTYCKCVNNVANLVKFQNTTQVQVLNGVKCPSEESRTHFFPNDPQCISGTTNPCPKQDCAVLWSDWSQCSKSCGDGVQTRSFTISALPQHGGAACPTDAETRPCNVGECKQDCVFSYVYGDCSVSCGNGTKTGTLSVTTPASGAGAACPTAASVDAPCVMPACPAPVATDCEVGAWTQGACSVSCGSGTQVDTRVITKPATNGGKCDFPLTQTVACTKEACPVAPVPVDCEVGAWTPGTCSVSCGSGTQVDTRVVTKPATDGGKCDFPLTQTVACVKEACPVVVPVPCMLSEWFNEGSCSVTCGAGVQNQTRTITAPATNGGACPAAADASLLKQTVPCNGTECPAEAVNCEYNYTWSACSVTCGDGQEAGVLVITKNATNGGTCNAAATSSRPCSKPACATDTPCADAGWTDWSACSKSCGGGTQSRSKKYTGGGPAGCPAVSDNQGCNSEPCPATGCQYDQSEWTECKLDCGKQDGSASRSRVRSLVGHSSTPGCQPDLTETEPCQVAVRRSVVPETSMASYHPVGTITFTKPVSTSGVTKSSAPSMLELESLVEAEAEMDEFAQGLVSLSELYEDHCLRSVNAAASTDVGQADGTSPRLRQDPAAVSLAARQPIPIFDH